MTLRLAVFGQAPFGRDVAVRLAEAGHEIAYTHVPPDRGSRADPLAAEAEARGWPLVRHKAFRRKGEPIPERVNEFLAAQVDLCPSSRRLASARCASIPRFFRRTVAVMRWRGRSSSAQKRPG
jgi:hypothetical protein